MAFALLSLPTELVLKIFEDLVPSPYPTYPTGTRVMDPEFRACSKALHSLSLACSVTRILAQPLLYNTVAIKDQAGVVMFLATLIRKREFAQFVKNFAVLFNIRDAHRTPPLYLSQWNWRIVPYIVHSGLTEQETDFWDLFDLPSTQVDNSSIFEEFTFHYDREEAEPTLDVNSLLEKVVAVTLCLLARVEDVLITESPAGEGFPLHRIEQALTLGREGNSEFFRSLRSVRVQTSASSSPSGWMPQPLHRATQRGIDPFALPTYELARVQRVELAGDNGSWTTKFKPRNATPSATTLPDDRHIARFKQLRDLRLYDSRTDFKTLTRVLSDAKSLETLHYTSDSNSYAYRHAQGLGTMDTETFDDVLLQVSKTLKELHLRDLRPRLKCLRVQCACISPCRLCLGSPQQIQSLTGFNHLTHLSVDIRSLQCPPRPVCEFDFTLAAALPESLVELELVESWYYQERCGQKSSKRWEEALILWTQSIVLELLRCVAGSRGLLPMDGQNGLPNLKKVKFEGHLAFHEHEAFGTTITMGDAYDDDEPIDHYRDSDLQLKQHLDEGPTNDDDDNQDDEEVEDTGSVVHHTYTLSVPTYRRLRQMWANWYQSGKRYRITDPKTAFGLMYRALDIYPHPVLLKTDTGTAALIEIFKEVGVDFRSALEEPQMFAESKGT
ncbi:hypothetical protein GGR57DRAFT_518190 [Xylariaceae sp. FL1272]|nr:hypothetical protein GGR57DRAFT_518190 [Xylariaceae sp. FL1272]